MTAILSLMLVLSLSFLVTRIATTALALTGVSYELAKLQAVSAFTGVGFTTHEAEHVVSHPLRRRIVIVLMILGNAGIITAVSSLVLSVARVREAENVWAPLGVLVGGPVLLWLLAANSWVEGRLGLAIRWALERWTRLEAVDYLSLLQLTGDYTVREIAVRDGDWLEGKKLEDCDLFREGVTVLGVHREEGEYVGAPRGGTRFRRHDRIVVYGVAEDIEELQERRRGAHGDVAHDRAVERQERTRRAQEARERREEP